MSEILVNTRDVEFRWPAEGSRWRHYKGGIYMIVGCATEESSLQAVVVYRSELTGYVWTRPMSDFFGMIKQDDGRPAVPRFALVAE